MEQARLVFAAPVASASRQLLPSGGGVHPDVLAAQRSERTRIRSAKDIRRGGRRSAEAA
ncbi:hypothetical protein [Streptomyces sp. RKAG290]|uniref:hypothetical protein n=1 Tax=Streptomyces sp. RKAG290 TaxID=2888348 RepID=UPI0020334488|nr:hypothetical protein [Streptomyces sp. RKAG290]MCM2416188.1 hypothetical protein [Streptomyces sp. RKAG290]